MTGSLQTKNGKYYAVINIIDENGKRKQKWFSTKLDIKGNKKNAEKFLREKIQELEEHENSFGNNILLCDYIEHWLNVVHISVRETTYLGYLGICNTHLIPYFKERQLLLTDITRDDLQEYINYKYAHGRIDGKGGLSPKTIKEHKIILQLVFKEADKNSLITKNPCQFLKLPQVQQREPSFYTKTQVKEMLFKLKDTELYPLIYTTVFLGLRRSELLGIKWDSIDFERKMLTIKHTVVRDKKGVIEVDNTKTKSSYRTFPLNDDMYNLFVCLKEEQETNKKLFGKSYCENNYVFKWADGKPYSPDYITHKFSKLLKQYNLPHIRFHDLRHTCASLLIDSGYQLKDIQEWLGHADIQTTANIYGHIDIERKKSISNNLANLI